MHRFSTVFCVAVAGSITSAQPDLVHDWVVVGDPGNRDTTIEETEGPFHSGFEAGGVDYAYRILETELTVEQQFEFVVAYYPLYADRVSTFGRFEFTGFDITVIPGIIRITPGHDPHRPGTMSWEYFARYCNWLHHGMVNEPWAYDDGAYDTSTFYEDPPGVYHHQLVRSLEARYWIPSLDEWLKAAHWDQSLNGGEGGYWQYPAQTNEPLPAGLPEDGGQRNAGRNDDGFPLAVKSYPDVQSYYGLYDTSGGRSETLEDFAGFGDRRSEGSSYYNIIPDPVYPIDSLGIRGIVSMMRADGVRPAGEHFRASDLDEDGRVNFFDVSLFIRMYLSEDERVDFRNDGVLNTDDVRVFIGLYENQL